jgi:hypothetical protein
MDYVKFIYTIRLLGITLLLRAGWLDSYFVGYSCLFDFIFALDYLKFDIH